MLFEEFFKKKKINLATLEQGQPGLFLEFKEHYAQMGEKSFDHTKKYWFNRLRHEYPLPVEVKTEKVHIENQIAEQTVAEALTEPTLQAEPAKLGFRPKFKTGSTPAAKPVESVPAQQTADDSANQEPTKAPETQQPAAETAPTSLPELDNNTDTSQTGQPAAEPAKLGFKPRFKAGVTFNKPVEETNAPEEPKAEVPDELTTEQPTARLGFKPRFKAGVTTNKPVEDKPAESNLEAAPSKVESEPAEKPANETGEQPTAPKLGFKPRFKAGVTTSKPLEEKPLEVAPENIQLKAEATTDPSTSEEEKPEAPAANKLGFKPRFKAGVTTTQLAPAQEETEPTTEPSEQLKAATSEDGEKPVAPTTPPAKQPYKPRFNPNMMKPKPPAEGENE